MASTQLSDVARAALGRPRRTPLLRFDAATLLGLVSAFGCVAAGVAFGGPTRPFYDLPSIFIVIGGTVGITLASFSGPDFAAAFRAALKAFRPVADNPRGTAQRMLDCAWIARRQGLIALERFMAEANLPPLPQRGLRMVLEGMAPADVRRILEREVGEMAERHRRNMGVFRKAAEVAPAMGLIGTLIGLVQMLAHLDNPASIGPAMAVALLTTFYGAVLACMFFSPLGAKLERRSAEEIEVANICVAAAVSMAAQENPRHLQMMLNTILPPSQRLQDED